MEEIRLMKKEIDFDRILHILMAFLFGMALQEGIIGPSDQCGGNRFSSRLEYLP
jgi:hypothetical protein